MAQNATQFEPTAGEEQETTTQGDTDGASDTTAPAADETQSVEGGEPDSDGGGADQEAGADGEQEEGKADEAEGADLEAAPVDAVDQLNAVKKEILEAIKGGSADDGAAGGPVGAEAVAIPEFAPEHIEKIQERYGVDGNQANLMREMVNLGFQKLHGLMQSELSGMRYEKAIEAVSKEKGFEDVPALRKGMDEFLKDFAPTHRSNPVLVRKAAIYARGLNAKAQVKAAAAGAERKTQMISRTKPAGASSSKTSPGGAIRLTPTQKSMAALYPGGESAYIRDMRARDNGVVSFEKRAAA